MKVKDYVKLLQELDQEKEIVICYDCGYSYFDPIPQVITKENKSSLDFEDKYKIGDYIIDCY